MLEKKRRILTVVIVGALVLSSLALAGCIDEGDESTVVIGMGKEPASMNPISYTDVYSDYIFMQIFDPLVRNNPDGETNADGRAVADSYEVSDDAETYTFELEEGIKFHNGEELVADDVVFTLRTIMNKTDLEDAPISPREADFSSVESVEATDDYTVKIHMKKPDIPLLRKEGFDMNIVPKDYITENGWDQFEEELIGTGPYEFKEYQEGEKVLFEKSDNYERGEVNIDKIEFTFFGDETNAVTQLRNGEMHYMARIKPSNFHNLKDVDSVKTGTYSSMGHNLLRFKQKGDSPFTDKKVRKALAYAIDTPGIIEEVQTKELADNTRSPIPPDHVAHADMMKYEQDIDEAKSLLEEANYSDGLSTELYVPNDERADEMQILKEQVSEAGFDIELVTMEWSQYLTEVENGNAPLSYSGWSGSASAYSLMNYIMSTSNWNWYAGWYNNTEYNDLINQANSETDSDERNQLYKDAQKKLVEDDMGVYMMYTNKEPRAYHESLTVPEDSWNTFMGAGPLVCVQDWELE